MSTSFETARERAAGPPAPSNIDYEPSSQGIDEDARAANARALLGPSLPASFYARPVLEVAESLVGCVISCDGGSGLIVETEAYHESEPACHAFVGLTARTRVLFGPPGRAYVYRSYGIHALFNFVCEPEGVGAAVLLRAVEPLQGHAAMRARRGGVPDAQLCSGPGKLTQALGIGLEDNGVDLSAGPIGVHGRASGVARPHILAGPRVGIAKAVDLPWRFALAGNKHVSRPRIAATGG